MSRFHRVRLDRIFTKLTYTCTFKPESEFKLAVSTYFEPAIEVLIKPAQVGYLKTSVLEAKVGEVTYWIARRSDVRILQEAKPEGEAVTILEAKKGLYVPLSQQGAFLFGIRIVYFSLVEKNIREFNLFTQFEFTTELIPA